MARSLVAPLDLTGKRFSRLVVIGEASMRGDCRYYDCRCDCGNQKEVARGNLLAAKIRSCGCLEIESRYSATRTHGRSQTAEYKAWCQAKARCENPKNPAWADYGGRGIRMCGRWQDCFAAFFADMGPRPSANHSIDRIDNDGNYEPLNCRWATRDEQANNKRNNRNLEVNGESHTMAEWSRIRGIKRVTVEKRIARGWTPAEAVFTPVD